MERRDIKNLLDKKCEEYNNIKFIENDPISIPHLYSKKEDIEISAFFAAIFAWGKRNIIINKSKEFLNFMDDDPHNFILNHSVEDLNNFKNFKHRTFNYVDAKNIIYFLKIVYTKFSSLENAFCLNGSLEHHNIEKCLINFYDLYCEIMSKNSRTKKHISSPLKRSSCKKLNMFLRWMVRKDNKGVDFGIWEKIKSSQLIIPCDVHVLNISNSLGLVHDTKGSWKTAIKLTDILKKFNTADPTCYDFALFGLGIEKNNFNFGSVKAKF